MVTERRGLKMHPKLLLDVIKRQAGSLHKAILEGTMNAIEARCSRLDITFESEKNNGFLTIEDDGEGIGSAEDIKHFFETFGTPHDASEHKTWAQFRMGRGQLFSFGKNTWRTATFKMVVDIKRDGLEYELTQNLPHVEGCKIEISLYQHPIETWDYSSVDNFRDQIKKQVCFMPVDIFFNGDKLNTPAADCEWTDEDPDAYYLWGAGVELTVYNLGAFCKTLSASNAGNVGIIVSKKQLKVNFARNDIQSDCEVWTRIKEVIKANRIKRRRRTNRRMTDYDKESALQDLRDGVQDWKDIKSISMIPTANDRYVSLDFIRKNRQPWAFAQAGSRAADRIIMSDRGMVFSEKLFLCLNYTGHPHDFFVWLLGDEFAHTVKLYNSFSVMSEGMSKMNTILPTNKLNVVERRILKWLTRYSNHWRGRTICIGTSDTAIAWTDGSSYIVLERKWLSNVARSYRASELIATLIHEACHDDDSADTHVHGEEFYRAFHDIVIACHSPMQVATGFYAEMRRLRAGEKLDAIKDREEKAKAKAKVETVLNEMVVAASAITPTVKKGLRGRRRRPLGAR